MVRGPAQMEAKERGYKTEALTCRYGGDCRQGLNCPYWHSDEETQIFVDERDLRRRTLLIRCGFCARGGVQVRRLLCAVLARCCGGQGLS